ncbi:M16 family metallopeptidase [Knoellia koreensis]|uniref:Insulinase family protein n=1 Tax=Knoellia koreensis TaxID=2730921 RepID=A0A849HHR4_9MICO|nr:pitrilysin family protein [Knoellia sp. DB2414S]NNM45811.1 insulinase family protein [Knoellia sp. DB2414S]
MSDTTTQGGQPAPEVPRPDVTPPGPWEFATPREHTLDNGLRLLTYDIPGQYVVSVRTVVPFPLSAEPREVEGVAAIMARMLDEGTAEHSSEEFAELLERKGIALGAGVNDAGLAVDLDVPKGNLEEALDLLRQVLADPVFPQPELDRHLRTRLAEIEQERALGPQRAARELIATIFDPSDRGSRPTAGAAETVKAITREHLAAFHAERVGPRGATVVIAGDLTGLDVAALAGRTLGSWSGGRQVDPGQPDAPVWAPDRARVVLVDRPGAVQSELLVAVPGPDRRADGGWAAYPVLGFVVGGAPNARVDAVLREEKGYTYGIRSAFRPRRVGGLFITSGSVRADSTVDSVRLLLEILDKARDGFTDEEVRAGVDFISKTAPGRFATADAVADEASMLALEGLTTQFTTDNLEAMRALTPEQLAEAWRRWVTGEWTVIVVGDASTYADAIRDLGVGTVSVVPA